ncbi:MAG: hydrogenase maturation peptidase HycI [Candidatus Brocadiia bacterium]|nr:MAG: hydrogenase maturation peptidase HycI [Candidatus Brocadiia bacterium]
MACPKHVISALTPLANTKTVIVCIGNSLKGDDGAGPEIYEKLKGRISADLINAGTVPENYISRIAGLSPQNLLIIDAVDFKADPGEIRVFDRKEIPDYISSTHSLSPGVFAEVIRKQCNVRIYFLGIQPASATLCSNLSDPVRNSVNNISDLLTRLFYH